MLSLTVLDKFNDQTLYPIVRKVYASHIDHCKNHIRSAITLLQLSIESSQETGNIEFLGYGSAEFAIYLFFSGENLAAVNQKILPDVELVESFKQDLGIYYLRIARQVISNLSSWGATAKVKDLENLYFQVISRQSETNPTQINVPTNSTTSSSSALLDLAIQVFSLMLLSLLNQQN